MAGRFRWAPLLRLLLGLALVAFLIHTVGLDSVRSALAPMRAHPAWIAAALALTFAALFAGVVRWHVLLRRMGLPTAFARTFQGFFIGQFFNAFLFGACGGDLARAVCAAHDHPEKRAEAVMSVFLDRAIGLLVTLLFGCAWLGPRLRFFAGHAEARPALALMGVFLLAALGFLAAFFARDWFERIPGLRRLARRGRIGPLLRRAYDAVFFFRENARHLLVPALLSLANLLLLAAATAALARALEIPLAGADLLAVFPLITVLAAVPLTPGSLGVRETLYVQLLHPFGIWPGPALMLSLLGYLAATAWSLFGGLLLLRRAHGPAGK
ncbi:MAG: lysylphosphatidylglycerol synthase transmembrane domain-containing protein [Kiritimatiellia bacterium]